ncbi:hypothetical protein RUM43_005738 [Polyplax serrata]|uniref:Transmembrane protein n=1 Tax=Polyplax serrata TaxID=468196 RepID=A0AAN8PJX3_POLSC
MECKSGGRSKIILEITLTLSKLSFSVIVVVVAAAAAAAAAKRPFPRIGIMRKILKNFIGQTRTDRKAKKTFIGKFKYNVNKTSRPPKLTSGTLHEAHCENEKEKLKFSDVGNEDKEVGCRGLRRLISMKINKSEKTMMKGMQANELDHLGSLHRAFALADI